MPTPVPTPTPTPANPFSTAEYRASRGLVLANAIPAYQAGATGRGVLAGVIDSGIDIDSPEFAGRISPLSRDTAGNASIQDAGGHGTAVSTVLAAAKNDSQVHGVAFDATLLVLRTDEPGSCAADDPGNPDDGCTHPDPAIARALDVAAGAGARVVNISLGGGAAAPVLQQAIARATAAGVVIVFSAGNDSADQIDPFARVALDPALARGLIIVAGSTNAAGTISDFSNRAGSAQNVYVTALGERVQANDESGQTFLWNGTSFAAPHVAGAIALLAQAFPTMTGQQLVELLLSTARDAGAAGVDPVYGRGLLDIGRAFQPQGQTALAGSGVPVSLDPSATLSSAMGDAGQGGESLQAVVLDKYARAFGMQFSPAIRGATPRTALVSALQATGRSAAIGAGGTTLALTIAPGRDGVAVERLLLSGDEARQARAMAGSVATRLGASTEIRFAIAQGADALVAAMGGRGSPAFLVARDAAGDAGFEQRSDSAFALSHRIGRLGLTVAAERGNALVYSREGIDALRNRFRRYGYSATSVTLDRRLGGLALSLGATRMIEQETVIGARFDALFGARAGRSWFVDGGARWQGGHGWSLGASYRQGWTQVPRAGALVDGATLRTTAFSVDAGKRGLFGGGDAIAVRFAQPLRVADGGLMLSLPAGYDYATGVTGYAVQRVNLAPTGRELDYEVRYDRPLGRGRIGANLFLRSDPGNYAALDDDVGAALRFTLGF
ncbi:S8 family peptidase [Sphingomonas sanxanigenens]|uniref:Peptidase S8/S53 domain-containing protein n=1 Tax=Sphingomonas sanxanigenens DSM 19645 = NX02 TaxID=1123269 RepID=W0AGN5_9SPHN|nr:S8 family peptidase [Sphingomonas sanxanigenens]AHE57049.1 hypothetical protein NX02_27315 [Sphingomonas sanxanigenens DSM 19645 = NX02]